MHSYITTTFQQQHSKAQQHIFWSFDWLAVTHFPFQGHLGGLEKCTVMEELKKGSDLRCCASSYQWRLSAYQNDITSTCLRSKTYVLIKSIWHKIQRFFTHSTGAPLHTDCASDSPEAGSWLISVGPPLCLMLTVSYKETAESGSLRVTLRLSG